MPAPAPCHRVRLRLSLSLIASLLPLGCASSGASPGVGASPPGDAVTFRAESAGSPVAGALVLVARGASTERLGTTSDGGEYVLPRKRLARLKGSALLFCWDGASLGCGAVRLDTRRAAAFDWLNVEMPSNRLVDPARVKLRKDHLDRAD